MDKKRRKRNFNPPIWHYIIRKMKKAERNNAETLNMQVKKLISKYFPEVNQNKSFHDVKMQLKVAAKRLLSIKEKNQIQKAILTRYNTFNLNISKHLDLIMKRNVEKIDTSYIKNENEFLTALEIVQKHFFNYYKTLYDP